MSFDTIAENRAFAEKFAFNFPLLCDTERTMGIAYGAASPDDKVYAKRVGCVIDPQGKIKEWLPKVDAKGYPADVLARL